MQKAKNGPSIGRLFELHCPVLEQMLLWPTCLHPLIVGKTMFYVITILFFSKYCSHLLWEKQSLHNLMFFWVIDVETIDFVKISIGILFQKFFWPTVRKNCSSDWEKTFDNSRLKAKNLQDFWDQCNNFFNYWNVNTIFET